MFDKADSEHNRRFARKVVKIRVCCFAVSIGVWGGAGVQSIEASADRADTRSGLKGSLYWSWRQAGVLFRSESVSGGMSGVCAPLGIRS